jgi:ATP-binding cassette subfamily B protein
MSKKTSSSIKIRQIFKHFWIGLKPTRWFFISSYLLYFLSNMVFIIVPTYYKKFFDILGQNVNRGSSMSSLIHIIVIVLVLHLVNWVLWRSGDFFYNIMITRTMARLRQNAFSYIIKHSHTFFSDNFTGGITAKIYRFVSAFQMLNNIIVYQIMSLLVTFIGSIAVTWFYSHIVSYLLLVWIFIFTTFNIFFSRWKFKYDIGVAEADSKSASYLSDAITNSSVISAFTGFAHEDQGYLTVTNNYARKSLFSMRLGDIIDAIQALLTVLIEFFIFYYVLKYWELGLATIGIFVLVQSYIISLAQQLWGLNKMVRVIYQGLADAREMVEVLDMPYEIKDIPNAKKLEVKKGEIVFKNVGFNFNETREVLKDLNVTIKAGEKLALVGPSGVGKTTFVRLIMRLYELTKGQIEIDGQDIHAVTQDSLRENISLVPQDPVLFHRTLLENIRYGRRDATDDEVKEAARLAHCDEFIDSLPLKYDTFVGERGIKLSGGERQRVAIARAILKHAPILILDEATSSLDSHSEMLIQDALDNLMKGCTTIVIAHRLSTIRKMDRIIAMRDGQIVEQGTHTELAELEGGLYKKLWDLQAGGFVGE